jgi:hypothetical protein
LPKHENANHDARLVKAKSARTNCFADVGDAIHFVPQRTQHFPDIQSSAAP